jgi:hypothetical protein
MLTGSAWTTAREGWLCSSTQQAQGSGLLRAAQGSGLRARAKGSEQGLRKGTSTLAVVCSRLGLQLWLSFDVDCSQATSAADRTVPAAASELKGVGFSGF